MAAAGWIFGDCFGEVCTFAFSVACRVEIRDVRLFFPSRPGSDVSPGTQRSLVRYATTQLRHNFTFPNLLNRATSENCSGQSELTLLIIQHKLFHRVDSATLSGTKLRPIRWPTVIVGSKPSVRLAWDGAAEFHTFAPAPRSICPALERLNCGHSLPQIGVDLLSLSWGLPELGASLLQFSACHKLHQGC